MPPVLPMLAKAVKGIPDPAKYGGLSFEPKWDGFRCLVFKDGDEVELASRNTKPLTRYFPEVAAAAREQLPERCVLDGELFVALPDRRRRREAGVRDAAGADPPGREPDHHARREDPGGVRGVRPARARGHVVPRHALQRAARGARGRAGPPQGRPSSGPVPPDPHHDRPGRGRGVVPGVRGRRARRRDRQARRRDVPAQRPHDAQDQARAHRRRGGRRLPRPQDLDAGQRRCSAACSWACTPTASCSTSASAPASPPRAGPSCGRRCRSSWSRSRTTRGAGGRSS